MRLQTSYDLGVVVVAGDGVNRNIEMPFPRKIILEIPVGAILDRQIAHDRDVFVVDGGEPFRRQRGSVPELFVQHIRGKSVDAVPRESAKIPEVKTAVGSGRRRKFVDGIDPPVRITDEQDLHQVCLVISLLSFYPYIWN